MKQQEKLIENSILRLLNLKQVFAWKVKTTGTYDPTLKRFRKPSPFYMKGVSDILGLYKGRFIAIEVKTPKGKLTIEQKLFQERVRENGGIAIVARSVVDVEILINKLNMEAA